MAEEQVVEATEHKPSPEEDAQSQTSYKRWKMEIAAAKRSRSLRVGNWQTNVDYRRGKVFETSSDSDRIAVNQDWPNTKAKQAQLYSQWPRLNAKVVVEPMKIAAPVFMKGLNRELVKSKAPAALDEVLPDVINAAGIGGVLSYCETKQEMVELPTMGRDMVPGLSDEEWQIAVENKLIPMQKMPRIVDQRHRTERISPAKLLWDNAFAGSDYNQANWVGRDGELLWADAKSRWNLNDEDKQRIVGGLDEIATEGADSTLSAGKAAGIESSSDLTEIVKFTEIFYWRYKYDPEEKMFGKIWHLVIIDGLEKPVVDAMWKGQKISKDGKRLVGSSIFPLQFLTLTYMSDEAVPPSDSEIGRPQVDELIESRTQMMLQRKHSQPLRWGNTSIVDPLIMEAIQRGTYQGIIPVDGNGEHAFGEIARANYPPENAMIDRIAKDDLQNQWQIGSNQNGMISSGETSAAEAEIVQGNFQTRIGYERARVGDFIVRISMVHAGLYALYGNFDVPDFDPEEKQRLDTWDRELIPGETIFDIQKDSTVLLDSEQERKLLLRFLNDTAQSGWVEVEPVLTRLAELTGLDPARVLKKPEPKAPEPPKMTFSFKGEDMKNPIALGTMVAAGLAPTPDQLEASKAMILSANGLLPGGPTGEPAPPDQAGQIPQQAGEANPDWHTMPRINTRRGVGEDQ